MGDLLLASPSHLKGGPLGFLLDPALTCNVPSRRGKRKKKKTKNKKTSHPNSKDLKAPTPNASVVREAVRIKGTTRIVEAGVPGPARGLLEWRKRGIRIRAGVSFFGPHCVFSFWSSMRTMEVGFEGVSERK